MLKSSRGSRAVRNGLVLGAVAAAAVGLTGCKAVPSFTLDSSATGVHTASGGDVSGSAPQARSDLGAAAARSAAGSLKVPDADTGSGSASAAPSFTDANSGGTAGESAPQVGHGMFIGTTDGGYQAAVAATGLALADHKYSQFDRPVPTAEMITVGANRTPWRQVAQAGPGSSLYADIVRWAQTLKSRGPVMVAYDHEPEAGGNNALGGPADYIAAYQHVETIFNQQGATNIVWTWQMTAWAFSSKPSSAQYAPNWYPGDAWVDNVGADAYNWLGCGGTGSKNTVELQQLGDPVLAFARAHGKTASFPEYGSEASPTRAQWLANAQQYFEQNRDVMAAAFYFNRTPPEQAHRSCQFTLSTPSEYSALSQMARATAQFTG